MTKVPTPKAIALLTRDSVAEANAHFTVKEKPTILPGDGLDLLSKLSSHPLFCSLTIAFLDHVGEVTVATEFKSVVHSKASFDPPQIVGLVFDFGRDETYPCTFIQSHDVEDKDWRGPSLPSILECESPDEIIKLTEDLDNHPATYKKIRSMVYFPAGFSEVLLHDETIKEDLPRMCYQLLQYCKTTAITHLKNGKLRKSINPNVVETFEFLLYNMMFAKIEVDFQPLDEEKEKDYFDLLALPIPHDSPTLDVSSEKEGEELSILAPEEPSDTLVTQSASDTVTPPSPAEGHNKPDPIETNNQDHDESFELPPLQTDRIPRRPRQGDSSESSDSDDEITEPSPKRLRTPTRRNHNNNIFTPGDLVKLASAFTQATTNSDDDTETKRYGSKKNKLNKMNKFKLNSILNACTQDCISPACDPPQSLVTMLENQTGPDLAMYIEGTLSGHNIAVCVGSCTALICGTLCNRMITSKTIQGFTNYAFGPREEESETYILQQSINMSTRNAISEEDKKKLLTQKQFIPTDVDGLKTSIRNTSAMAKMCFGKQSFIAIALKTLKTDLKDIDAFLKPYFATHGSAFGLHFAQTIHAGISLYLSKASNGIEFMRTEFLDFSDLLLDVQMQRLRIAIQPTPNDTGKGNGSGGNNNGRHEDEVFNQFKPKNQYLSNTDYRRLFSNRNRAGLEPPKMGNGTAICWNFHAKGSCRETCGRKNSHVKLNQEDVNKWNKFTTELNKRLRGARNGR